MPFSSIFHIRVNRFCQDAPPVPAAGELGQYGSSRRRETCEEGLREELIMPQPNLVSSV